MLVPHTHTHIYYISLKGVRKFKGLRLILVNSHIFKIFFYGFCVNCCHSNYIQGRMSYSNSIIIIPTKIISYIVLIKKSYKFI